ncbi:hypothetical protein Vadar_025083 [Vaccinium darrowii]|uniref:Uncharacterized protein n=1 Tax=Vaccinium darrowii TaxID=229202 RepID=A0ACB7XCD1_9ERIC|nr:hypothetical protein Vadar_025083 [Vaccinium darrowii]
MIQLQPSFKFSTTALLLFLLFLTLFPTSKATPTYIPILCPNITTYSPNSIYQSNLEALLTALSSASAVDEFSNFTAGNNPPDASYGLFLCRGDLSSTSCHDCVSTATTQVLQLCPISKWATIWYDECMLRYSDTSIFATMDITYNVMLPGEKNVTEQPGRFNESLYELMGELETQVASLETQLGSSKKFASEEVKVTENQTLYGLLQCTPDISSVDCGRCLTEAISILRFRWDGKQGGRILYTSCNVRYETYPFYSLYAAAPPPLLSTPPPPLSPQPRLLSPQPSLPSPQPPLQPLPSGKGGILWRVLVGVIVPIGVIGFCFLCSKTKKKYYISKPHASRDELTTLQSLQYDLSTVRAATNNFSDDNKIGMGGFGPVYKGTLLNGEEVAVKRLSKNSRQDSQEQEKLDWPQRYKIIQGIAHGMLYLHEYSSLRIIHRDLKAGNILLDGNMNAKISDFGMARIFDVDQTRAITSRVVGTYGYISPEYAMHGQFSVKSDVFSFGVLLLEVISGKKTNSFYKPDCVENLLTYAWKLWNDGTPLELMDQALEGSYSRNDVHRCIHIGLLCVQHNPDARPSMAKVVRMLNRYSSMSLPQQPAFFAQSRTTSRTLQGLEPDRPIDRPIPLPVNEDSVVELDHR